MTATLPLSAIIVVKNGEKTLDACLKSVRSNNPAEIIIIDGNSTDATLTIARRYTERIYSDEGKGVSFAHQLGLEKAVQPYITFVDADIMLPDGALATMLDELNTMGCANIQATLIPLPPSTYWERADEQHNKIRQLQNAGGLSACILVKDTALIVGFDPSIRIAGDDVDFLFRLKSGGHKIGASSVKAVHANRAVFKTLVRQKFWYGRAKPALMRKHGPWRGELWAPAVMAYWLAVYTLKGKLHLIPYVLVSGLADSAGMVKGLFELHGAAGKTVTK